LIAQDTDLRNVDQVVAAGNVVRLQGQYEIYVGHDTYMNKPCYDIRMWKKEQ